jgi:septal ring factor EnvC (AmiA/AmiB activator)
MSIITDILKEIPLSAVLRERLADAETKMAALEHENARLKSENENLRVDLNRVQAQVASLQQQPKLSSAWGSNPRVKGRMDT